MTKFVRCGLGIVLAAGLAGCASAPPPVAPGLKLAGPPKWATVATIAPRDIPDLDGDPAVRVPYQTVERTNHAQCVDRHRALTLWARKVTE